MPDSIRPAWLTGLRLIGPAEPILSDVHGFPAGSWIVRHSVDSRDLAPFKRAGHRTRALDDSHTLIAPALYIAR